MQSAKLATKIQDRNQQIFALAGLLAFTDKIIDRATASEIRRVIEMTQVAQIFEEEKQQEIHLLLQKHEAENKQAAIKLIKKGFPTEEIISIIPSFSENEVEKLRREM